MMNEKKDIYTVHVDESGEKFFCPAFARGNSDGLRADALDVCVEASTVGRYAGNLNIDD